MSKRGKSAIRKWERAKYIWPYVFGDEPLPTPTTEAYERLEAAGYKWDIHAGNWQKSPAAVGNMRIHNAGEVFNIRLDYKELDLTTGRTQDRTFTAETLATDAAAALAHALTVFNSPPPAGKIWHLTAHVEVQSDVLRDQLKDTQS